MNGYQPDFSGGYQPTGIPNNFKTSHPYNSYIDSYSSPARQQHMQMNGHIEYGGQRMNTNPNQYIQSQQQYSPMQHRQDTGSPSGGYNPLGYNSRRVQQQPPPQQIYQRPYSTNNYSQQQVSYANIAGQYIPSQPSIPVQSSQPTTKLVNTTNIDGNPLANLKMTLAEEKKQQEKSQEDYASRFLAAVQERVQNHVTSGNNIQIQQQYENYYEQSPDMYEFEASHQSTEQFQPSQELLERMEQSSNKQIIFEVQIGLEQLCAEPSEYEAWSLAIREALNRKEVNKVEDYEVVAWLICEMAIYSQNCQANFAKLSCYLMDYVQGFTDAFMPMFTYYHDARSVLLIEQVEHLLLFTAEIYERKLTITRSRTAQVAVMLIDQLRNIMTRPLTDHVIKTIVDVMKLSGYHLEQDTYKDAVDDIMKDLNTCTSDGKRAEGLTDTGAGYITMLMIHRNEWGKQQQNLPTKTENNPMDLTEEELGFLEKHNAINPAIVHNGSSSGELDDEILEDYEKFLRDHAEQTALASVEKIFEKLSVDEEDEDVTEENRKDDNKTPTPHKNGL